MSDPTGGWAAATTEALKALRELGGAIAEPIREVMGMATDHLKVVRLQRQVRLADRVRVMMRERGIQRLDRPISLNTLLPLLEHASFEEDDELQDTWARMLVNAGDGANPDEVRRAYVGMLGDMTAFDVRVLAQLEAVHPKRFDIVWTGKLPSSAAIRTQGEEGQEGHPSDDVAIALGNLVRLGCLTYAGGLGGVSVVRFVALTDLGRAFVRACTVRHS